MGLWHGEWSGRGAAGCEDGGGCVIASLGRELWCVRVGVGLVIGDRRLHSRALDG